MWKKCDHSNEWCNVKVVLAFVPVAEIPSVAIEMKALISAHQRKVEHVFFFLAFAYWNLIHQINQMIRCQLTEKEVWQQQSHVIIQTKTSR